MKHPNASNQDSNTHAVTLIDEKLTCDSFKFTFSGITCKHSMTIYLMRTQIVCALQFKERWKILYSNPEPASIYFYRRLSLNKKILLP